MNEPHNAKQLMQSKEMVRACWDTTVFGEWRISTQEDQSEDEEEDGLKKIAKWSDNGLTSLNELLQTVTDDITRSAHPPWITYSTRPRRWWRRNLAHQI